MPDNTFQQSRNIALLIDSDNASPSHLERALTILGDLGTVNVRRAYGNWSKPGLKGWSALIHRHAIEPQQQFDLTKGKNATDMRMTIDAMDLLYGGRIDGFGFMTSDSDFMPIAMRIRQNGVPVYGFGTARTPEAFREACTRFIDVDALAANEAAAQQAENASEPAPAPVASDPMAGVRSTAGRTTGRKTAAKAAPASATPAKDAPAPAAAPVPARRPVKPVIDEDLIKLIGDAWKASKRDENGFADVNELGQRVANRSSFDARTYGFSRLSELVDSLPNFATERRERGLFVKRLR